MSTGFLLVETVPGREADVLARLAELPGVTTQNVLYPAAIAVKVVTALEALAPLEGRLRALDGVVGARLYRAGNA